MENEQTSTIDLSGEARPLVIRAPGYQVLALTGTTIAVGDNGRYMIEAFIDLPPLLQPGHGEPTITAPERRYVMGYEMNLDQLQQLASQLQSILADTVKK